MNVGAAQPSEYLEFELVRNLQVLPIKVQILLVEIVEPYWSQLGVLKHEDAKLGVVELHVVLVCVSR